MKRKFFDNYEEEEEIDERKGDKDQKVVIGNPNSLIGWISDLEPLPCLTPSKFNNNNNNTTVSPLLDQYWKKLDDNGNHISFQKNILDFKQLRDLLSSEKTQTRYQPMFMQHPTPRFESIFGGKFNYSGVKRNFTEEYPEHIKRLIDILLPKINERVREMTGSDNPYTHVSNGISILYAPEAKKTGGGLCMHKDHESLKHGIHWSLILIYSVGQTRWLRIRRDSDGHFFNVPTVDNSLILMYGPTFQKPAPDGYTHGIDNLSSGDRVGARLTINIRFY